MNTTDEPEQVGTIRLVGRVKAWLCKKIGHSFSHVDLLMFKIESEGRCYTVNLITGERKPLGRPHGITCRRCGTRFEAPNVEDQATRRDARR
jgi:hypothetical protein